MKGRISYLDSARGFAILLVVVAHTIGWNFVDWKEVVLFQVNQPRNIKVAGFLWQIIYSFHMPLFFMISGYLNYKIPDSKLMSAPHKELIRKTMALMLPYISTGFIMLLLKGYYGYWFFLSLWQLSLLAVLFNILPIRSSKWWMNLVLVAILYLLFRFLSKHFPHSNFGIEVWKFNNYLIPFFFGYFMRKYVIFGEWLKGKITWYIILFGLLFSSRYLDGLPLAIYKTLRSIAGYLLPLLGSLVVLEWFRIGIHPKIDKIMNFIGQNTMDIYIFHLLFVFQISAVGNFWLSTNLPTCISSQIVYALLVSTISITLSLGIAALIHKSPFLSLLLFGKKIDKNDARIKNIPVS